MPKRFINSPESVVDDVVEGISLDSSRITLIDPDSNNYICISNDVESNSNVKVISGGGAGHEPFVFGYLGKGLLSGAVSGNTFTSPSSSAVSTCIKAVSQGGDPSTQKGILVIVMNYTGDRLNFGLAATNCKQELEVPIEVVTVGDDVTKGRGIAGTVLVAKIAGAAAAEGRSLRETADVAMKAAESIASIGVALTPATLPGYPVDHSRLNDIEIEIGMGIHNEPGAFRQTLDSENEKFCSKLVQNLMGTLSEKLLGKPEITKRRSVAFLVNNLGAVPAMEMQVIANCVADFVFADNRAPFTHDKTYYMLIGTYMTSLDMNGMSISVFMMDEELERLLLAKTDARAWQPPFRMIPPTVRTTKQVSSTSDTDKPSTFANTDNSNTWKQVEAILRAVLSALRAKVDVLTEYDKKVGDGDFGITLSRGIDQVEEDFSSSRFNLGKPAMFLKAVSNSLNESMGGTSGAIFSIFFSAASSSFNAHSSWHACVQEGTEAVMKYGGASIGDRTLIDALQPASQAFISDDVQSFKKAVRAARVGADESAKLGKARAGRSEYVSEENLKGVPDPGAVAVALIMESILTALS